MLDPKGRVIMISGANRGIGLAVARGLAAKGYDLSLAARDAASLEAVAPKGEGEVSLHRYDAAERAAGAAWVEATIERHGRIDGLVNNAGIFRSTAILDEDESGLDDLWAINVKAPLRVIRAAVTQRTFCVKIGAPEQLRSHMSNQIKNVVLAVRRPSKKYTQYR